MGWLEFQYFLLVFVASCGLLQAVFAYRKVSGLQFFPRAYQNYLFSFVATVGAFVWFYATDNRNAPPVLDGSQQTGMFFAGSAAAVVFTAAFSSVVDLLRFSTRAVAENGGLEAGLDALKRMTYSQAIPLIARELRSMLGKLRQWRGVGRG